MHSTPLALTALLLVSTELLAQPSATNAPASSASSVQAPLKVRTISFRPSDSEYPAELSSKGVQGKAEVLVVVGEGGVPKEMTIATSSRSTELDAAAIQVVSELKFNSKQGADQPLPSLLVPVEFLRDSIATLPKKTCAEFNIDVEYFKKTLPEVDPSKMSVIYATVGTLVLTASQQGLGDIATASKRANAAAKQIAAACAASPDAMYLQLFHELARKSGA